MSTVLEAPEVAPVTSTVAPLPPASERLVALDAFRGMTIAGMLLVNNPGTWSAIYPPLEHAPWHGWTPTAPTFPFFPLTRITHLRFPGVLQRIGVCYLAAALLARGRSTRAVVTILAVLLFGY